MGGESAQVVAQQALLFEEFIAREAAAGRFTLKFKSVGQPILLHGHCHQKAFGVVGSVLAAGTRLPMARSARQCTWRACWNSFCNAGNS